MLHMRNGVVDVLVDALDLLDFLGGNVLEHLHLAVLVTLETLCAQVYASLQALVHVYELMLGAEVADFGLIDLSRDAIHDMSADLAGVGIRYAIKGSQLVLLHVGELIQVLLCQLRVWVWGLLTNRVAELHLKLVLLALVTRGTSWRTMFHW